MTRLGKIGARDAFDAAAEDFAALGRYLWEVVGADAIAVADPQPGERVLDACCGTGASAIPTAVRVGSEGLVDAVDISGPMIAELRRRSADLPQLHAHEADVTTWGGSGYDLVQSVLGIFFFADMEAGAGHLISTARTGGRIAFTIWRRGAMDPAGRQLAIAVAEVTDAQPPGERPTRPGDRINSPEAFSAWLSGLGVSEVDVKVQERTLAMTREVAWLLVIGSGYRGVLSDLSREQIARVRERYLARLEEVGLDELDASTLLGTGVVG